ncbi:hypothetical protein NC653_022190 [Populus alba x Populus x berolinensis]|uniref:Uncharacterized protein n=1 Tax=Populus alba x Populus x berolinensis TaxID=444605 RepID=A0AAD6QFQ6_9ROSI|nr:hypothetical protein NC653_022190 [Populus alba x Populus x berolinensis]
MCKTILICFNECFAHQPDSCPRQFGLLEVRSNLIEFPKIKYKRRFAGTKGQNWEDGLFSSYIQIWRCRKENFIGNPSRPLQPVGSPPLVSQVRVEGTTTACGSIFSSFIGVADGPIFTPLPSTPPVVDDSLGMTLFS